MVFPQPDLVDEYVSEGGHAYRPDLRVAIFKFINKHLKYDTKSPVKDVDFEKIDPKKLRVFPTDADIPEDAINAKIDEVFLPKAEVKLPKQDEYPAWQKALVAKLREQSFRNIPMKVSAAQLHAKFAVPAEIVTEPGIKCLTFPMPSDEKQLNSKFGILWVADQDDKAELKDSKQVVEAILAKGAGAFVVPRGGNFSLDLNPGPSLNWTKKSPPNFVERAHVLLGRTVDEGRVRDVIAALKYWDDFLKQGGNDIPKGKRSWIVIGFGNRGILAAYAALLEPSIEEVIIFNPPKSHMEGPTFLNVLKILDIPERWACSRRES